jgi:hypothetical protein
MYSERWDGTLKLATADGDLYLASIMPVCYALCCCSCFVCSLLFSSCLFCFRVPRRRSKSCRDQNKGGEGEMKFARFLF